MPDVLLGLIWVQIVCKGNQQTTLVSKEFMTVQFKFSELTRNSELGIYTKLKEHKDLPAKAISLLNFVISRRQVQVKMLGFIWIHTV